MNDANTMEETSRHASQKPKITIYPDYGHDGWHWINFKDTDSLQGGFSQKGYEILMRKFPKALMENFRDWHLVYTRNADDFEQGRRPFDWQSFHYIGIQLSVRLKQALKDDARVFYEKPMEDPNDHLNQRREVLIDGQLV
jgi:hypothetical protein